MAMRLDVGCGGYPTGDVNCDLARTKDWFKGDVICDCHHLPFIDRSFDEVYSSHTIEHVSSPYKMLLECERVASKRVTIVCPTIWHWSPRKQTHLWTFGLSWFTSAGYQARYVWANFSRFLPIALGPFRIMKCHEIIAVKDLDGNIARAWRQALLESTARRR